MGWDNTKFRECGKEDRKESMIWVSALTGWSDPYIGGVGYYAGCPIRLGFSALVLILLLERVVVVVKLKVPAPPVGTAKHHLPSLLPDCRQGCN